MENLKEGPRIVSKVVERTVRQFEDGEFSWDASHLQSMLVNMLYPISSIGDSASGKVIHAPMALREREKPLGDYLVSKGLATIVQPEKPNKFFFYEKTEELEEFWKLFCAMLDAQRESCQIA